MITDPLMLAGASFAALYVSHSISDHWIQTDHQAAVKGERTWRGSFACARHVATHTAVNVIMLVVLAVVLDADIGIGQAVAALAVIAVTHYVADRRYPLEWLAVRTRHQAFITLGRPRAGLDDNPCLGTGAYALDQSWHHLWLFVAAVIIAV